MIVCRIILFPNSMFYWTKNSNFKLWWWHIYIHKYQLWSYCLYIWRLWHATLPIFFMMTGKIRFPFPHPPWTICVLSVLAVSTLFMEFQCGCSIKKQVPVVRKCQVKAGHKFPYEFRVWIIILTTCLFVFCFVFVLFCFLRLWYFLIRPILAICQIIPIYKLEVLSYIHVSSAVVQIH